MIESMIDEYGIPATVKRSATVRNSGGDPVETFADHIQVCGVLEVLKGSEQFRAERVVESSTHRFWINGVQDITRHDKIETAGHIFGVTYVDNPLQANRFMKIELVLEGDA